MKSPPSLLKKDWDYWKAHSCWVALTPFPCRIGSVLVREVPTDSKLGECWVTCDGAFYYFLCKNLAIFSSMLCYPYLERTRASEDWSDFPLGPRIKEALLFPPASPSIFSLPPMFPVLYQGLLTLLILLRLQALPGENNKWGNRMNLQRRGVGFVLQMDWFSGPHTVNAISRWVCFSWHLSWGTGLLCALKSYRSLVGIQIVLLCESQSAKSPWRDLFSPFSFFPLFILILFFLFFLFFFLSKASLFALAVV